MNGVVLNIRLRLRENGEEGDGCFDCELIDNCGRFPLLHRYCADGYEGYFELIEVEEVKN